MSYNKVNALDFWDKIEVSEAYIDKRIQQENKEDKLQEAYVPPSIFDSTVSTPLNPIENTEQQKAEEPEQQKEDKFKFPKDSKVWHFHPIAFVEQMKRICDGGIGYVDWEFIGKREGKLILKGYVPTKTIKEEIELKNKDGKVIIKDGVIQRKVISKIVARGKSGVTISTGFDIGQHNKYELKRIFKSNSTLYNLYLPYASKKKQEAISFLAENALEITKEQAELTDKLVKQSKLDIVIKRYNEFNMPIDFKNQSIGIQTVVTSICFQYGAHSDVLLKMWEALEDNDNNKLFAFWEDKITHTEYAKRRKLELSYLKTHLNDYN